MAGRARVEDETTSARARRLLRCILWTGGTAGCVCATVAVTVVVVRLGLTPSAASPLVQPLALIAVIPSIRALAHWLEFATDAPMSALPDVWQHGSARRRAAVALIVSGSCVLYLLLIFGSFQLIGPQGLVEQLLAGQYWK